VPRGADDFVARAELAAKDARLLGAAAGLAGRRAGVAAARGPRATVLVVPFAPEAARPGVLALAAAGGELAFCVFVLVLPGAGAARRAGAAAGFLVCLVGAAVARVPRAVLLPVALPAAAARGAALRLLAAGAAFLAVAAEARLRSAVAGRDPRAGVFTAPLRAVGAFGAAGLPVRDGAAVLALPWAAVLALRALGAAAGAAVAFRLAVAGLLRVVDADGWRPAGRGRVLLGGALLPGRFAMITSETSGRLTSNRFAVCAPGGAAQSAPFYTARGC